MSVAPAAPQSSPAWLSLAAEASRAIDALAADATQRRAQPGHGGRPDFQRADGAPSSTPPTASPGSPPMPRRCASLPPMAAAAAEGRFGETEELLVAIGRANISRRSSAACR